MARRKSRDRGVQGSPLYVTDRKMVEQKEIRVVRCGGSKISFRAPIITTDSRSGHEINQRCGVYSDVVRLAALDVCLDAMSSCRTFIYLHGGVSFASKSAIKCHSDVFLC